VAEAGVIGKRAARSAGKAFDQGAGLEQAVRQRAHLIQKLVILESAEEPVGVAEAVFGGDQFPPDVVAGGKRCLGLYVIAEDRPRAALKELTERAQSTELAMNDQRELPVERDLVGPPVPDLGVLGGGGSGAYREPQE
jgi:hypothetical protein